MSNSFMSFMESIKKLSCGKPGTSEPQQPTSHASLLADRQQMLLQHTIQNKIATRAALLKTVFPASEFPKPVELEFHALVHRCRQSSSPDSPECIGA